MCALLQKKLIEQSFTDFFKLKTNDYKVTLSEIPDIVIFFLLFCQVLINLWL